jgi:hypothetical protein
MGFICTGTISTVKAGPDSNAGSTSVHRSSGAAQLGIFVGWVQPTIRSSLNAPFYAINPLLHFGHDSAKKWMLSAIFDESGVPLVSTKIRIGLELRRDTNYSISGQQRATGHPGIPTAPLHVARPTNTNPSSAMYTNKG